MGTGDETQRGKRMIESWVCEHRQTVVGATSFIPLKENLESLQFDLVVFDESSQVRVPESAIATSFLSPEGRIVFAGDDYQLPPIVAGTYQDPENGPALHRSIFEALLLRDEDGTTQSPIVYQLTENFRQNDVLTSYARELLYPGYSCASLAIADRRLELTDYPSDPVIDTLLDPGFPLVVGIIDGVQATKENTVESDLIARLVLATRDLLTIDGKPVENDATFWSKGVFVVSPHRAQNAAIRRELTRRRDWDCEPFVDTVDKMQGQEAQAVFVSYGVSDPEFAMMEADFIYSRNRLNVAISRAKAKTVVLMSRDLVRGVPGVLEFPEAAAGLAYIRAIINQLRDDGQTRWFELDGNASIEIVRSDVPFGEADEPWSPVG
jgi:superfamily I DNA and/or RNA helicase